MFVTAAVFHALMLVLKAVAPSNMPSIVVTAAVFHALMSALNEDLYWKSMCMSVIKETSQVPISPHCTPMPQMSGFAA
jgi:hypothetical protein